MNKYNVLALRSAISILACNFIFTSIGLAQMPEEIVVTARKTEESLQEVPLSITAFTSEQIREVGAVSNHDIANITVNFNTMQQTGRRLDRPVIRGMSAPASRGEPNASYFIDGVYVSGSVSTNMLGPVERVEVLRGPQSAQFGRATFSGAVNYVTRKPTDEFEGEILTRIQSHDTYTLSGWTSGPIIRDTLRFFASAGWERYGGTWENQLEENAASPSGFPYINPPQIADKSSVGGTDTREATFKLQWTPTDATEISYKIGFTRGDDDHYALNILEVGELNCYLPTNGGTDGTSVDNSGETWFDTSRGAFCGTMNDNVNYVDPSINPWAPGGGLEFGPIGAPANGDDRQTRFNLPDYYKGMEMDQGACEFVGGTWPDDCIAAPTQPGTRRDQWRHLLELDQALPFGNIVTRLAYNTDSLEQAFDLDHTEQRSFPGNLFNFLEARDYDDKSAELIYLTPGEYGVRSSIGLYWYKRDFRSHQRSFTGPALASWSDYTTREVNHKSVFGSFAVDFATDWTLSLEARYFDEDKDILGANKAAGDANFTNFTPRVTLNWQTTDDIMLYALVAKGNKPGDFNQGYFAFDIPQEVGEIAVGTRPEDLVNYPNTQNGDAIVDEEKQWTYEIGAKTSWLDRKIIANISAFYINWENQGLFGAEPIDQGGGAVKIDTVIRNAGKSEIYGFEFESTYVLTPNLAANLSVGLTQGEFKKYNDEFYATTTGINDPDLINNGNVSGFTLPNSPKWNTVMALNYQSDLTSDLSWFWRTDYVYESKRYTSADNFMQIPERHLWNGRIGIEVESWTITTYVSNILDRETPSSILNFRDLNHSWRNGANPNSTTQGTNIETWASAPTPGRNVGLEMLYRFGQ